MKNLNCLKPEKLDPINLFVTGGARAGKSHLIKAIYHTEVKTFRYGTINPERPTVALMAPTGVAAININGTTIHTALSIPKEFGDFAPKMSDQKRTQLRLTLSELKLIIVDEISLVANTTLLHIHQRLKEIFNTPTMREPTMREPITENKSSDHPIFCKYAAELLERVTGKFAVPSLSRINKV